MDICSNLVYRIETVLSREGPAATFAEADTLPATAWAVLGILSFNRELSGYMVKQWADHALTSFYMPPAISQVYSELKRLEALGYVRGRDVLEERRTTRVYRLTAAGRRALVTWLETSPVELPVLKHGVLLRVWLGHLGSPSDLRRLAERHRQVVQAALTDLRTDEHKAEQDADWTYPAIVFRWGIRYYEHELRQIDELLAELDRLEDGTNP
jgi:DNA-binding PadR family transcriptional regulator